MSTADIAEAFEAGAWEFTPDVVAEFDHHVRQSIPFYDTFQSTVAELADWLAPARSQIVDLGCSTGETFKRMTERHPERSWALIGYDDSEVMLKAAVDKVPQIVPIVADLRNGLRHQEAALTLALFTLQFLPTMEDRKTLLQCARIASRPDGAILVAEKVRPTDARWFEIGTEVSWDYKADAGINSDAIRAKARALRGVLRPLTVADNLTLMKDAGWVGVEVLFRFHQWVLMGGFAS